MEVSVIAAIAKNRAIGKNNRLLWRLPLDMKFFKDTTVGYPVITGRRNYESIPEAFRPLPGRQNIVVTRTRGYQAPGAVVVHSLNEAINAAATYKTDETFIIGGGQIYREAMAANYVTKLYLTFVDDEPEADVFFPEWNPEEWEELSSSHFSADDKHAHSFDIRVFKRVALLQQPGDS